MDITLPEVHCAPGVRRPEAAATFAQTSRLSSGSWRDPVVWVFLPCWFSVNSQKWAGGLLGSLVRTQTEAAIKPWESSGTEPFNKHLRSVCCLCLFLHKRFTVSRWELLTPRGYFLSAEKTIGWSWLTAPPWRMCSIRSPFSS